MIRVLTLVLATALGVAMVPGRAEAQSPVAGKLGLGVVETFGGNTGLNLVFDGGPWHAEGLLFLSGIEGDSRIDLGARGWFHLHSTTNADFSVGGGLGIDRWDPSGDNNTRTVVGIDLGFNIRAFVTSNVAVGAFGGLRVATGDRDGFQLGGTPLGAFSLTYFF
jgi:hypothetical protein